MQGSQNKPTGVDLKGRTAIVTGANAGLGLQTAMQLGQRGAHVVLACRSVERAEAARLQLQAEAPAGVFDVALLDLGDLESVRAFAQACKQRLTRLDMLCNNAGIIAAPFSLSPQGFELHMAINYFGPFVLTGLLLDLLRATPVARIVNISSQIHRISRLPIDDLNWGRRSYKPFGAYAQSKLAVSCWTLELDRRLQREGFGVAALLAHPGFASTDNDALGPLSRVVGRALEPLLTRCKLIQSAADGAKSSLYALTSPLALGGDYIGPDNWLGCAGAPARAKPSALAADPTLGAALWERSVEATGVSYLV